MNKTSLSQLSIQQLKQAKYNLTKRIDDLKFFNLDLGRENIRLAEEYRRVRELAEKIVEGKAKRVKKAKSYNKNIYVERNIEVKSKAQHQKLNRNNWNFNDLYKVSKSKLVGWLGKSNHNASRSDQPQEIYPNSYLDNGQQYQEHGQQYQEQVQYYGNPKVVYQQNGDYPEAVVEKRVEEIDPIEQPIEEIVSNRGQQKMQFVILPLQSLVNQTQPQTQPVETIVGRFQRNEINQADYQHNYQPIPQSYHYQRLYHSQQQPQYLNIQIKTNLRQNYGVVHDLIPQGGIANEKQDVRNNIEKKAVNGKGFEFDDLPKMGWKKLKGWMGFGKKDGGKGKVQGGDGHVQQSKQTKSSNAKQYNPQMQPQQYQQLISPPNPNPNPIQLSNPNPNPQYPLQPQRLAHTDSQQLRTSTSTHQRKRTPIFPATNYSPLYEHSISQSYYHKPQPQDLMREQKIQKDITYMRDEQVHQLVREQGSCEGRQEKLGDHKQEVIRCSQVETNETSIKLKQQQQYALDVRYQDQENEAQQENKPETVQLQQQNIKIQPDSNKSV